MSHLQGTNPYSKGKRRPGSCLYSKHIAHITVSHQRRISRRARVKEQAVPAVLMTHQWPHSPSSAPLESAPHPQKNKTWQRKPFLASQMLRQVQKKEAGRGLQGKEQQGLEALPAVSRWHLLATPSSWEAAPCFCQAGAFALALRLDSEQLNKVIARVSLWATFCCFL